MCRMNVSTSYKIDCGVFNIELDKHNKLSMKRELFCAVLPILRILSGACGFCNQECFPGEAD